MTPEERQQIIETLEAQKQKGQHGATYGDTMFGSLAVCYGINEGLDIAIRILSKLPVSILPPPPIEWCDCENRNEASHRAYYVPDNTPNAMVKKHHYLCAACHKLVQIG